MGYYSRKRKKDAAQTDMFQEFVCLKSTVEEFIQMWNSYLWLPKVGTTDRQCHAIREALERPFFRENWRKSFPMMARSPFLQKKRPRFQLDWYLEPDNFDKIMEGFYLPDGATGSQHTTRNGDDEEIL